MIVFDLECGSGHVFEAWFGSSGDYEDQRARGFVVCPICDSREVTKAAMAPAVSAKGNRRSASDERLPVQSGGGDPAKVKALLADLAREQAKMLEKSDYVGRNFATEARAMHDGEKDERSIHGETTLEDVRALLDDGIPVAPLPLPVRPPKSDN
ncbi:MAG: DUF1178 family protein [Parasphingopyxis sp.]